MGRIVQKNPLKPQKIEIAKCTWSDCKQHHNTVEFLVFVLPNSTITLSKVYTIKASDKAITLKSCFLDVLPRDSNIKAFVPIWQQSKFDNTPIKINKNGDTTKKKKVSRGASDAARHLKTFRIIFTEMSILLL